VVGGGRLSSTIGVSVGIVESAGIKVVGGGAAYAGAGTASNLSVTGKNSLKEESVGDFSSVSNASKVEHPKSYEVNSLSLGFVRMFWYNTYTMNQSLSNISPSSPWKKLPVSIANQAILFHEQQKRSTPCPEGSSVVRS
jgi:hypothetical protein